MASTKVINHMGKEIIIQEMINSKHIDENIRVFNETKGIILTKPPKSVLLITDVSGAFFNTQGAEEMKKFSTIITPHVKASAVVGIEGLKKIILRTLISVSGRDIKMFNTQAEAKEWLIKQ